jgi:propanediol dehydratase small subunit
MNQQELEKMIKSIINSLGDNVTADSPAGAKKYGVADYPLGEKIADQIKTPTGKSLSDVSLDALVKGDITAADVRIRPETLEIQAQVAEDAGRYEFASNLRRAAELIPVPDERILEIYNALRPYHSTKSELLAIAEELETKYGCKITPTLVREAAEVGEARGRLKKA